MCRLFGFKSAVVSRAHRSLVAAENALSQQARHHPDGWGIGYFHQGEPFVLKATGAAAENESFRRASERLASHTFVVHVRRATVGAVAPANTHPFRSGRWLFAHNGTLHGFDRLGERMRGRIPEPLRERILGTTDTETLFYYLLAALERRGVPVGGEAVTCGRRVGDAVHAALERLYGDTRAADVPPPIVNFLLTNGSVFVAHRSGRELHFATQKASCADFATCPAEKLCMRPARDDDRVNHLLVASERIGAEDRWEEVPDGGMLVLGDDFRLDVRGPVQGWRPAPSEPVAPALQ